MFLHLAAAAKRDLLQDRLQRFLLSHLLQNTNACPVHEQHVPMREAHLELLPSRLLLGLTAVPPESFGGFRGC